LHNFAVLGCPAAPVLIVFLIWLAIAVDRHLPHLLPVVVKNLDVARLGWRRIGGDLARDHEAGSDSLAIIPAIDPQGSMSRWPFLTSKK
jgi:hypothetical protein